MKIINRVGQFRVKTENRRKKTGKTDFLAKTSLQNFKGNVIKKWKHIEIFMETLRLRGNKLN